MNRSDKVFLIPLVCFFLLFNFLTVGAQVKFAGVNLAGAEFGEASLPGVYNQHYTYPTRAETDYFTARGMNVFRLPFRWERLQQNINGPLNTTELSRIKSFIDYATSKNACVILDPHNYARYYGKVIGSEELPVAAFADFWGKIARQFRNNPLVIFGIMNEPHNMSTERWLEGANAAIAAIRSAGAGNLVLVPGNGWTGAHSWSSDWYGTPNSQVMLNVVDSLDNYAYEVHQYLDSNSSGTSSACVSTTTGADRLKSFTGWLRANNKRGFLGEFGVAANATCLTGIDNMLTYMAENADVWLGWTWWAAGPWWGDYMFSVEPVNGQDKPQMEILKKHAGNRATGNAVLPGLIDGCILYQNYPNPFRESTEITFYLSRQVYAEINVFNPDGQKMACLFSGLLQAGYHSARWDAHDMRGNKVPGGIYFYSLKPGKNQSIIIKKMLVTG